MIATLAVAMALLIVSMFAIGWVVRRRVGRGYSIAALSLLAVPLCFSLFLAFYIFYYLAIPAPQVSCLADVDGITLSRVVESGDDPTHIVFAKVDLQKFAIGLSPPDLSDPQLRFSAMTTSDALREYGGVLVVNASFFRPFRDKHLFDYFPHQGDLVEAIGRTVFESKEIAAANSWPMLWLAEGKLRIGDAHTAAEELAALAELMVEMGVADAIELDGGGSSTMAAACCGKIKVINRPSHTNLPARERPVANHLIVRKR